MSQNETCGVLLRTGICVLDPEHPGRHSTVGFRCDGCGKMRRGTPEAFAFNPWDSVAEAEFCFMCVEVSV